MYLNWFKTLPLFYETDKFRAVHACWDYKSIDYLKKHLDNNRLTDDLLHASTIKDTPLYDAIEITLKGKEFPLPDDKSFLDKDHHKRTDMRIRWWVDLSDVTYKELQVDKANLSIPKIQVKNMEGGDYYKPEDKPVFFGHYWLEDDRPSLFRDNICCLDYSVAESGHLVAYSLGEEKKLEEKNLNAVKANS